MNSTSIAYREATHHPANLPLSVPTEILQTRDETTGHIIQLAIDIHRALGRGHPAEIYRNALAIELARQDYHVNMEMSVPVYYREFLVGQGCVDLAVADYCMIAICTSGEQHEVNRRIRQLKSMLRAGGYRVGLILDFGHARMMDGIKRVRIDADTTYRRDF